MRRCLFLGLALLATAAGSMGDIVKFKGAGSIKCTVLQDAGSKVTVLYENSLLTIDRSNVESVTKDAPVKPTTAKKQSGESTIAATPISRIPDWWSTVKALAAQSWATELQQIPATVIDKGVLRNVPYKSHRCGEDYEINIYGDPAAPAGFEIGIYRSLLNDSKAKKHCIDFVCSLLGDKSDASFVRLLKLESDIVTRAGITFEITPPTAEDAYGGWWVSVYDEAALDKERATDEELAEITVARTPSPAPTSKATPNPKEHTPPTPSTEPRSDTDNPRELTDWKSDDLRRSRRPAASSASTGGGRVYVRGYYRKDGTYVKPYSRKK